MRVAITGARGFIGSALRASFIADGHDVIAVTRSPRGAGELGWDPSQRSIDGAGLEGLDAVVHLAGEPIAAHRWNAEQRALILDSRVQGTDLLATTLAELDHPPRVLVSGSAIGLYGERGQEILTEDSAPGTGFLAEVVEAWEAAAAPAIEAGIRVPLVRTGLVLGREGGALAKLLLPFRFGLGGRLGSGRQWWSWISLTDEVRALRWCIDHDLSGPVNLVGPAPVTNAELTRALGRVLHRPSAVPVPRFGPRLLLGRELADELLFTSQRALPIALEDSGFTFEHPDVTAALAAELGRTVD